MLSIEIDNAQIASSLYREFDSIELIKEYLYTLVRDDLEDRELARLMADADKKKFVSRDEIMDRLSNIAK